MSKLYTKAALLAMMSMVSQFNRGYEKESKAKKATQEEINRANGLREFVIEGEPYWAINYKNAIRKFNKKR